MKAYAVILQKDLSGKITRKTGHISLQTFIRLDGRKTISNNTNYVLDNFKLKNPFLIVYAKDIQHAINIADDRIQKEYNEIDILFNCVGAWS